VRETAVSLKAQAVMKVTATWLGPLVHALVSFFLSPFILHRLGDQAFSYRLRLIFCVFQAAACPVVNS
jgi:hypothetical protein